MITLLNYLAFLASVLMLTLLLFVGLNKIRLL
uniref:Cytochrome b6-f complex subunit 6 n=1 Tax=Crepidomanes minutum TaxID=32127 RepID=A0A8K1RVJ0_9MONI|nr:cytochrome b6/f complex subunit VI [Crepidomanes minutum]UEQ13206.1 cytochrome b6/f complex subunit VI [Crepidomanes minutum]